MRKGRADPAHAVINHKRNHADHCDGKGNANQALHDRLGCIGTRQAFHACLERFKMHDIDQRDIADHSWQKRMLDHVEIGNADIFHHQKGRGPHDRRHDLTIDRAGHFYGPRLLRRKAHLFHQRNGECPGGHHIGDRRAGNQPGHRRGDHRRLGGAALHVAHQAECHLNEIIACSGPVEQGAKQHEQEHE